MSHLSKIYDTDAGQVHALDDVSLDIPQGTFVTIVGASGCGKSSLLKILAGLELATDGIALRYDRELDGPSRDVGIAFQEHVLFPWLTVLENVMLPADIYQLPRQEANGRAQALLEMSGLKGFENRKPHNLSGGMKQRAALCRALLTDPEVLLLDEPFGALDALTREELSLELLRIWEATRKTALLITHDINEAVMLSDTIVVMSRRPGRIVEIIPVDLPRPRGPQSELHPRFREIAHHIRELIFARRSN
ncbi:ABC transporter ATP-binding protein [Paraburkholderia sp. JHI2823]